MGQHPAQFFSFFFWEAKDPRLLCRRQSEQSCVWPLRHLKLFGESLQMRIRSRAWKKNSGTGDSSSFFLFFPRQKRRWKSKQIILRISQRSRANAAGGGGEGTESSKHQRASLSSLKMLFILLTGLLTSLGLFSKVSLGSSRSAMEPPFSLYPVRELHYLWVLVWLLNWDYFSLIMEKNKITRRR